MSAAPLTSATILPPDFLSLPQDRRYETAVSLYGRDLSRFVTGYERVPVRQQDLLQEVHLALWQSLAHFRGDCALRTWTYRVAHNTCASHVRTSVRAREAGAIALDEISDNIDYAVEIDHIERSVDLQKVLELVHALRLPDRQVMMLYLEGLEAVEIAELVGLAAPNVATKIHRIKSLLARRLNHGRSK